jgi:hypothetical protein
MQFVIYILILVISYMTSVLKLEIQVKKTPLLSSVLVSDTYCSSVRIRHVLLKCADQNNINFSSLHIVRLNKPYNSNMKFFLR